MDAGNKEAFLLDFTYNTNAIEQSSLTREQVGKIISIMYGRSPNFKKAASLVPEASINDVREAIGLYGTITDIVSNFSRITLTLDTLLAWHERVFAYTKPFAGQFRKIGEEVYVGEHKGVSSLEIHAKLLLLLEDYYKRWSSHKENPRIELASWLHCEFEMIHPFRDGNGRIGRLLFEYALLANGQQPINITYANRQDYYGAIRWYEQHNKNTAMFIDYLKGEPKYSIGE
jgi:Fic family protein